MALIRGGPAGPDGFGGAYDNTVQTDRAALWQALGGRQGVLRGFVHAGVAGQMALDFTPGAALVGERDGSGVASINRGYLVHAAETTRVLFGPASASARNDAVVAAFVDVEAGPVGTGGLEVGGHLVVVPGVSGTSTPRTDAQINAFLGRGGWVRVLDVPIASGATEIAVSSVVVSGTRGGPAFAKIAKASNQSVPTASTTAITFSQVLEQSQPGMADVANNRIVIPDGGVYSLEVRLTWDGNSTGRRDITLRVNGSALLVDRLSATAGGGLSDFRVFSTRARLAAGDVIELVALQNTGGSLSVLSGGISETSISALRVAP
jgi:hypothetical protein